MPTYYAFVRRTGFHRYCARFPDLGGMVAYARTPKLLQDAAVIAARRAGFGRTRVMPDATPVRAFPRFDGDSDGCWMALDLSEALASDSDRATGVRELEIDL